MTDVYEMADLYKMGGEQKNRLLEKLTRFGTEVPDEELEVAIDEVGFIYVKALDKALERIERLDQELSDLLRTVNDLRAAHGSVSDYGSIFYHFADDRDNEFLEAVEARVDLSNVFQDVHRQHTRQIGSS
jgi:hypothetical protein